MPLQIRAILVASDLSEGSDEVVRAAVRLAALAGAEVHAIHAVEPAALPYPGTGEDALGMQKRLHEARAALTAQVRRAAEEGSVKSARVVYDSPHRAIEARRRVVGAGLVVVGAHRGRALGDRLLGTTADRLLRTSEVPCLVVRAPMSFPLRRVLVPTDLSEPARLALAVGFAWAAALGLPEGADRRQATEVEAVHVVPLAGKARLGGATRTWIEERLHEQVERARRTVAGAEGLRVREEIALYGSPASQIVRLSGPGTDLLVLGTHGRGALGRALIGSVASAVARHARCPVLLVPPATPLGPRGEEGGAPSTEEASGRPGLPVTPPPAE